MRRVDPVRPKEVDPLAEGILVGLENFPSARHLQGLELRRPLDSIADPAEKKRSAETRAWFRTHFLTAS